MSDAQTTRSDGLARRLVGWAERLVGPGASKPVVDAAPPPAKRRDAGAAWAGSWVNETTGFGTSRDKTKDMWWVGGMPTTVEMLEQLFAWNDLVHAIVVARPEWGLRHGWDLTLEAPTLEGGTDVAGAVEAQHIESAVRRYLDGLNAHEHQLAAAVWGELHGGGLILLGIDDGRSSSEPLDEENIRSIEWIRPVPARREVIVQDFDQDAESGRLGQPILYRVQELHPGFAVHPQFWHHSRVIRYPGAYTPPRVKAHLRGWDLSRIDRVLNTLAMYDGIWGSASVAMSDGSQGAWSIKGLHQASVTGLRDQIEARMEIADKMRSMFKSILLDADQEKFEYMDRSLAGIAELLAQSATRLAAAAEMPATVLFGQSPSGMNATGESDIRLWYDRVEHYQESVLRSRLERLIELSLRAADGPTGGKVPAKWRATFRPVRKALPMEELEMRARQAQIDNSYISNGTMMPPEVAVSRFTSEGYSLETVINVAAREKIMAASLEKLPLSAPSKAGDASAGGDPKTPDPSEGNRQLPPPGGGPTNI